MESGAGDAPRLRSLPVYLGGAIVFMQIEEIFE